MSNSKPKSHSAAIVAAIIGGIFTIIAACIGLGVPFVEWVVKVNLPTPTPVRGVVVTSETPATEAVQWPEPSRTVLLLPSPTHTPRSEPNSGISPTPTHQPINTPTPISVDTAGAKTLGGFYEANGIAIALSDYNIKSDGTIWLKFTVVNQGNRKVLLRYQNNYFSVSDDTGRVYPQDEDFLLDPKQVELDPGESFEIEGDGWPKYYHEIGYFYGKVPEQANYLIVKVSQLADLRDMQWVIPLNALLSSPQSPVPGTQQPPLEGFTANGITVLLADYNIKSDGTIWLKFIVRNEGNNSVLLRYQNKYFEVYDDLGNRYEQDQDFVVEPKQVLLAPGESFEIEGDGWPEYYHEIGYFYGKVPEQANYLIVKVSQFADLRDMQWKIPLR